MRASWPPIAMALACLACGSTPPAGSNSGPDRWAARPGLAEVEAPDEGKITDGQVCYVPAYSHVDTADNRQPLNLAATLYVRNTDLKRSIVLTRVQYHDSGGKLLREYLARPIRIGPLASADFFVREGDASGGASPSFLVDWVATESTTDPIIESVMIGISGTQGISFTCPGRVLEDRNPRR